MALVVTTNDEKNGGQLVKSEETLSRTSSLPNPIMKLTGHSNEVLSCDFSPCGRLLGKVTNTYWGISLLLL